MKIRAQSGFTLIELIVVMAVAAILLGVGVPSFTSAIKNSRQSSTYQSIVGALYLARSEAVKRSNMITVCARKSATACDTSADWKQGWIVFNEMPQLGNEIGRIDPGEAVLALYEEVKNDVVVEGMPRGTNNTLTQHFIQYGPQGFSNWRGGTIVICDDRKEKKAKAMNIVPTGDIRKARPPNGSNSIPTDFNGDPVECPG